MTLSNVLGSFASRLRRGLAQYGYVGADEDGDALLVIGIDFGTTSSGVGWATAADIKSDWLGSGREEGKAPTELFYEHGKTSWGFGVGQDCDPVRWFKLLLLKEEDLAPNLRSSEFVLRARQQMRDEGKTAVDLVADYLRAIWAHTMEVITKARGEVVVDVSRFHVVITVPAIWKGHARQTMRDAGEKAGILKKRSAAGPTCLSFVAEPEATALSTLSGPGRNPKKDEVYLICDGGGGTVVSKDSSGGVCGAMFIDQAFERKVKKCLGRKWDRLSKLDINELMSNNWEYGPKHQFSLSHDISYVVTLPSATFSHDSHRNNDQCDPPIKEGRMVLTRKHIQAIFDEVITEIDELADGQIADAKRKRLQITGIILVEGLDSSPYLYERLQGRHKKSKINVLQSGGERPRVAICRGAVLSGFLQEQASKPQPCDEDIVPVKVVSTIARASYGLKHRQPYDPAKHKWEDISWYNDEQGWFCLKEMRWYLEKGSNVTTARPVCYKWYQLLNTISNGPFRVELFQCEELSPPALQNSSVMPLCTITCKLATPVSDLPDYSNSKGQRFKKVWYDLDMVPSGACVELSVWAGGKKLGSSEAQIRFE
ncbi:hsp70 family chaperone [Apiospora phragmitis]|uniref:Hsp70 family chaperone n=1 Tax=Apiospora phragmitis TaxID=2905665 RepID=A0ABR1VQD0_9PEZI